MCTTQGSEASLFLKEGNKTIHLKKPMKRAFSSDSAVQHDVGIVWRSKRNRHLQGCLRQMSQRHPEMRVSIVPSIWSRYSSNTLIQVSHSLALQEASQSSHEVLSPCARNMIPKQSLYQSFEYHNKFKMHENYSRSVCTECVISWQVKELYHQRWGLIIIIHCP